MIEVKIEKRSDGFWVAYTKDGNKLSKAKDADKLRAIYRASGNYKVIRAWSS